MKMDHIHSDITKENKMDDWKKILADNMFFIMIGAALMVSSMGSCVVDSIKAYKQPINCSVCK